MLAGLPLLGTVQYGIPMAELTYFRIGGPADAFLDAAGAQDVHTAVSAAVIAGLPYHVIGWGTNLLVRDGGVRGLVVRIGPAMSDVTWDRAGGAVIAEGGAKLRALAQGAAEQGLAGLEFAEGIPGGLGGAVAMNAGAYDGEVGELVDWVEVLDLDPQRLIRGGAASVRRLTRCELDFGYRRSALQGQPLVVVSVRLSLDPDGDPATIRSKMAELAARRRERQPLEYPSAGSYFMRPPGGFAGSLIEGCGLKGFRIGGAVVSPKHANFIINVGGASAADVLAVAEHVRRAVQEKYGVWLQTEVRVIGQDPPATGS